MSTNVINLHRYGHLLNSARSHNQEEEEEEEEVLFISTCYSLSNRETALCCEWSSNHPRVSSRNLFVAWD